MRNLAQRASCAQHKLRTNFTTLLPPHLLSTHVPLEVSWPRVLHPSSAAPACGFQLSQFTRLFRHLNTRHASRPSQRPALFRPPAGKLHAVQGLCSRLGRLGVSPPVVVFGLLGLGARRQDFHLTLYHCTGTCPAPGAASLGGISQSAAQCDWYAEPGAQQPTQRGSVACSAAASVSMHMRRWVLLPPSCCHACTLWCLQS